MPQLCIYKYSYFFIDKIESQEYWVLDLMGHKVIQYNSDA